MRRNLIFTRELTTSFPAPAWPDDLAIHTLTRPTDSAFAALDRLYVSNGFRPGWANDLLKGTARAIVAVGPAGQATAAAWLLREPFYVSEIQRTFDPGADADYYFGDFVAPSSRGRGLQQATILHRLALSTADNRRWAIAMTRQDNASSCKNYQATGFAIAAHLTTRSSGPFSLDRFRRIDSSRPTGHFSDRGFPLPFGTRLYRRR